MAADEQHGVVDGDRRTFAVLNLLITDGSVLPTQGSANPALAITAVAARQTDRLIAHPSTGHGFVAAPERCRTRSCHLRRTAMADRVVTLPSGRQVGITGLGDPSAERLVLLCHPTPGASGFDPDPLVTARWGVHVLTFDRPGYGSSEPLPDSAQPSLQRQADDLAALVHRFEATRSAITPTDMKTIGVIGWGTGGLVAATLAAREPRLVERLALVGTPAPIPRPRGHRDPDRPTPLGRLRISEDDPLLDRPGLRHRLERMVADADLQHGVGEELDRAARIESIDPEWVASLSEARARTLVLTGAQDPQAGRTDARWYATRLPHARIRRVKRTGPLAIAAEWPALLEHVAPRSGEVPPSIRDGAPEYALGADPSKAPSSGRRGRMRRISDPRHGR